MALHLEPPGLVAAAAHVPVRRAQHALLKPDQPLHQLEGRTRRIAGLHGTVVERLPLVAEHLHIMIAALAAHQLVGIVGGRGDHHQDFARRGLDGHRRADLAAHQLLAEQLQACVDRADEVTPRLGQRIVESVHVGALDRPVGVALEHLHALPALQLGFVGRLHAADSHIVARLVGGVALEHLLRHLPHIAQQVASDLAGVVAHGAVDRIETAEIALVEPELLFLGKVVGHQPRRTGIGPGVGQLPVELLPRNAGHVAEPRRVESAAVEVVINHHQVVALAALHQILAVAVIDLAAGRVLHLGAQDVAARQLVVARIDELDIGQPSQDEREDQQHDGLQGPHPDETFGAVHTRTGNLTVKIRAMIQTKSAVTAELTAMRASVCSAWLHERVSSTKKTAWWSSVRSSR